MKNLLSHVYKHEKSTNSTHIEPCRGGRENLFVPSVTRKLKARLHGLISSDVFEGLLNVTTTQRA